MYTEMFHDNFHVIGTQPAATCLLQTQWMKYNAWIMTNLERLESLKILYRWHYGIIPHKPTLAIGNPLPNIPCLALTLHSTDDRCKVHLSALLPKLEGQPIELRLGEWSSPLSNKMEISILIVRVWEKLLLDSSQSLLVLLPAYLPLHISCSIYIYLLNHIHILSPLLGGLLLLHITISMGLDDIQCWKHGLVTGDVDMVFPCRERFICET